MKKINNLIKENPTFLGLIIIVIIGIATNEYFFRIENITNLLRSASIVGFISIGMTFVILCGSIDLSVGSVFALAGYFFIALSKTSIFLSLFIPILVGIAFGFINGILVTKFRIPAFVGTLSTMMIARSLVLIATKEATLSGGRLPIFLQSLGRGNVLSLLPTPFVLFSVICLFFSFVLKKQPIGRAMYIVGGNAEAATMMGVSIHKTLIIAHTLCGMLAGFGGIIFASRIGSAQALAGTGYELYAIAAVVLGGAQLSGGIGRLGGTFLGAIIMGSFTNIFNMQRILNPVWQNAVIGIILLAIIISQSIVNVMPDQIKQ